MEHAKWPSHLEWPIGRQPRDQKFLLACAALNKDSSEVPQFDFFIPDEGEKVPLHMIWAERDRDARQKRQEADDAARLARDRQKTKKRGFGALVQGSPYPPRSTTATDAPDAPSLQDLLKQQEQMALEAALSVKREMSEKHYIRLAGRTKDLTEGAMNDELKEARALIDTRPSDWQHDMQL